MTATTLQAPRHELWLALREEELQGRRQWQVAQAAGINPAKLSRIVHRRREFSERPPARPVCEAIARALSRPIQALFPDLNEHDAPGTGRRVEAADAGGTHKASY